MNGASHSLNQVVNPDLNHAKSEMNLSIQPSPTYLAVSYSYRSGLEM